MTDKHYLENMCSLTKELERAASAEPYDPDVYNDVVARFNALHFCWYYGRRRRQWITIMFILFLLLILAWIIYFAMSPYLDPLAIVEIWRY